MSDPGRKAPLRKRRLPPNVWRRRKLSPFARISKAYRPAGTHLGRSTRGYLPQVDLPVTHTVTFRLHDSVPATAIRRWRAEAEQDPTLRSDPERAAALDRRIRRYEDRGFGACWMRRPDIAAIVCRGLLHFDGIRYELHEWCVMPNHVHVLLSLGAEMPIGGIVRNWKGYTAHRANRLLKRRGPFWMGDYHDRFIRDGDHYDYAVRTIRRNPVMAGLCERPEDWPWSSCSKHPGYTRPARGDL